MEGLNLKYTMSGRRTRRCTLLHPLTRRKRPSSSRFKRRRDDRKFS